MRCQAMSSRSGEQCRKQAVRGKRVCRSHGGATPGGIASPHFIHGRYSKYLPGKLLASYEASLQDGDLLALRDEIALTDARLVELLEGSAQASEVERWQALQELLLSGGSLEDIALVVEQGVSALGNWKQIGDIIEQRRRLVESERRRLVDMNLNISAEHAMALAMALLDSVRKNVTDRSILARIQQDFAVAIGRKDLPGPEAGYDPDELEVSAVSENVLEGSGGFRP